MSGIDLPEAVPEFLRGFDAYLIVGHVEPDGDCIASQLLLARILERGGKRTLLLNEGPFDRPEIRAFQPLFRASIAAADREGRSAAVVVDCSTEDRLGALGPAIRGLPVLVIDHHSAGKPFGTLRWVRPEAPSVTYLVQLLAESLERKLSAEEAELALFGLCTDTGFFRHLGPESAPVFRAAAALVEAGASPQRVFRRIHSGWSLARVSLLAEALRRAERILAGRGLLTYWRLQDIRSSGESYSRGSDDVYRLLQSVEGAEVVAFLREEAPKRFSVGLRSSGGIDVGELAIALGGGGHRNAAGCTLSGTLAEVRRTVLAELERRYRSA